MEDGYQKDLEIAKHSLDWEWQRQAGLFLKYSDEFANANLLRDRAKENIEIVKAELNKSILADPGKFSIDKITVASVDAVIKTDKKVIKAIDKWLQLKYEAEIFGSAKQAFEHKKSALEHLAKLYLSGYWSSPRISSDAKQEVETSKKKKMVKKLNKSTRLIKRKKKKEHKQ